MKSEVNLHQMKIFENYLKLFKNLSKKTTFECINLKINDENSFISEEKSVGGNLNFENKSLYSSVQKNMEFYRIEDLIVGKNFFLVIKILA